MRALITGINGFVGSHLAAQLCAQGAQVYGIDIAPPRSDNSYPKLSHVFIGDILASEFLAGALAAAAPTHVFHLAGVLAGAPGGNLAQYSTNVLGTVQLLEALRTVQPAARVLVNSSSAVYGRPLKQPIQEDDELRPLTAYAASKAAQEMVAIHFGSEYGLTVVRARTFNLVGPRQSPQLVTSELARQVARAELEGTTSVRVGNLSPRRDYTDVRDAVRAYMLLASTGQSSQVYNVCSGKSHSVQESAEILLAMARVPLQLETDPTRIRSAEIDEQVGSPSRLERETEWKPEISFDASLADLLDDWRAVLNRSEVRS